MGVGARRKALRVTRREPRARVRMSRRWLNIENNEDKLIVYPGPGLSSGRILLSRGGKALAYPEPIPAIRGKKDIEEFERRLKSFKLTAAQKKMYREAIERYEQQHSKRRAAKS